MSSYINVSTQGASGTRYEFQVYPLGTKFLELPGVYVFTKLAANGKWDILYVGESHNLENRVGSGLWSHHKISKARLFGATHVGVLAVQGPEGNRLRVESDLCSAFSPPCNDLVVNTLKKLRGGF